MSHLRRLLTAIILLLVVWQAGGCGYRLSGNAGLYRDDVKTVFVPTVLNRTFYRSDSSQLTDALVREIQTRTPYRITDAGSADTSLEVTITQVRRSTTSRDRFTALPNEQIYVVVVDFTWKDLRSGGTLVTREHFEQTAPVYATLGEEDFHGSQEAAEALAAGIVEELTSDW